MSAASIARFPAALQPLFKPARYKILYGGRGGTKSWGIARALLLLGAQRPLRFLCARETQKSIADSVHHLLASQIVDLGMEHVYDIQEARIIWKPSYLEQWRKMNNIEASSSTEFIFAGLKQNISNLKSYEGCDIVWVEEAATVSKRSWEVLIPTIRKENSEIWVSFNPELDTDETYQRFVISPPPGAVVIKVGYQDNPWFPAVLRAEMEHLKAKDFASYLHVWEGQCLSAVEGSIYAKELGDATIENRITKVPYDRSSPVHTAWDLGFGDMVSIWMFQRVGFEWRFIDYEEGTAQALPHYLQAIQRRPYVWGTDYLPWDGGAPQLGTGKSIEELMRAAGRTVQVVKRLLVTDGINIVRTMFPNCYFDQEKCADGLQGLRRYRWSVKTDGERGKEPLHDSASHPADALRTAAVGVRDNTNKPALRLPPPQHGTTWAG